MRPNRTFEEFSSSFEDDMHAVYRIGMNVEIALLFHQPAGIRKNFDRFPNTATTTYQAHSLIISQKANEIDTRLPQEQLHFRLISTSQSAVSQINI